MDKEKRKKETKEFIICGIVLMISLITLLLMQEGLLTDLQKLQHFIRGTGAAAPVIFIALQIIQTVIPVIPGGVSSALGVLLFGPFRGFLYNYAGLFAGSLIAFLLAGKYGRKFIISAVGEHAFRKYAGWLEQGRKFDFFFAAAILLPGLPDDMLCMLSALTGMTVQRFILIILLCKPAGLLLYSMGIGGLMAGNPF